MQHTKITSVRFPKEPLGNRNLLSYIHVRFYELSHKITSETIFITKKERD